MNEFKNYKKLKNGMIMIMYFYNEKDSQVSDNIAMIMMMMIMIG